MENFVAAVRAVCFVSVGICIIQSITDGTRLRGAADLILKLIFAFTVTAPIVSGAFEIELPDLSAFDSTDYSYSTEIYENELCTQVSENISSVLREQLKAAGINAEKIDTEVNISQDGSISINRVIISTSDFEASAKIIRGSIGQETEVINGSN
jgi:biopolymer transport protein ExbD